jgi:hypothetical protein
MIKRIPAFAAFGNPIVHVVKAIHTHTQFDDVQCHDNKQRSGVIMRRKL